MHIRPYQKLIAWQEAHKLCKWIHGMTEKFPYKERNRLVDQMCRASYSVPMNLAEGNGKSSTKERRHYWQISSCSLEELHYQCLLSCDLGYITAAQLEEADSQIAKTSYLIHQLRNSLRS